MYRPTITFCAAIGIITMLVCITAWMVWAISQAEAKPISAISAADHSRCAAMPRGSQVMEMERQECFNELYKGVFRITNDGS